MVFDRRIQLLYISASAPLIASSATSGPKSTTSTLKIGIGLLGMPVVLPGPAVVASEWGRIAPSEIAKGDHVEAELNAGPRSIPPATPPQQVQASHADRGTTLAPKHLRRSAQMLAGWLRSLPVFTMTIIVKIGRVLAFGWRSW